jgi:hypothetical protein
MLKGRLWSATSRACLSWKRNEKLGNDNDNNNLDDSDKVENDMYEMRGAM